MEAEAILNQDKPAESTSADPDQILPMVPEVKLGQSTEEREREGRGGPGCRTKRCKFGLGEGGQDKGAPMRGGGGNLLHHADKLLHWVDKLYNWVDKLQSYSAGKGKQKLRLASIYIPLGKASQS